MKFSFKNIIIFILMMSVAGLIGRFIGYGFAKATKDEPKDEMATVAYYIKEGIKELTFPVMLDQFTRLDGVEVVGNRIIKYKCTLLGVDSMSPKELKPLLDEVMFGDNLKNLCQNPDSRHVMKKGFLYSFEYVNESKQSVASYMIAEQTCSTYQY